MTKADLRKQFLTQRKALPAEDIERRSQAVVNLLFSRDDIFLNKMSSLSIHTFLPIARQHEVNTWPIIHRIWRESSTIKMAVSITDAISRTLTHYPLTPETELVENRWGIPEPINSDQLTVSSEQFDLVMVPLLAFDLQGHRVGYGGGYYDRFLAQCRPDCLKIGLSLFGPVNRIDGVEETDVPLSMCITPKRVFTF